MTGPFVPIEDLSKHFSVSVSTIRAWVRQGHIPKDTYIKVGNTYRFSVDAVATALTTKEEKEPTEVTVTHGLDSPDAGTTETVVLTPEYDLDDDI